MVKFFCDRCGKEVNNGRFAEVSVPTLTVVQPIHGKSYSIVSESSRFGKKMLCTDCIEGLQIFLEGEQNGQDAV